MGNFRTAYRAYLLGAAIVAAAAGSYYFLRALDARAPIDDAAAEAMQNRSGQNTQYMQERLNESIAGSANGETQERMESPLGLAMFRRCIEWTEFHDNHPGSNAEQHRDAACGEYRRYVESGEILESVDQ